MPFAPGTFGTLLALPLHWLATAYLAAPLYLAALAGLFALGVWACGVTERALRQPDCGAMVWDEITAFLLVLFFTPANVYWQALAFVLFRFFDIVKPPPIRYYERMFKGGFGVMVDDIVAAFYALVVLAIVRAVAG